MKQKISCVSLPLNFKQLWYNMKQKSHLFKLKQDNFRVARGGYSRFLNLYCSHCKNHLLLYQKDGPGPLKRLYADRIIAPEMPYTDKTPKKNPSIFCKECGAIIAIPYLYEKETRLAFLINIGSLIKKLGKGFYPPISKKPIFSIKTI